MEEQADFFSPKHKRLLSIATWARYLAWATLILTIISVGFGAVLQFLTELRQAQTMISPSQDFLEFTGLIKGDPYFWIDILLDTIQGIFRAVIYYIALTGISLGLNMIVETDINYRERKVMEGNNE
jgi:hypothetical protein